MVHTFTSVDLRKEKQWGLKVGIELVLNELDGLIRLLGADDRLILRRDGNENVSTSDECIETENGHGGSRVNHNDVIIEWVRQRLLDPEDVRWLVQPPHHTCHAGGRRQQIERLHVPDWNTPNVRLMVEEHQC